MKDLLNTTAATTVAPPLSSDIFDRLIGDRGSYSFEGLSLDDGMKALVSALEEKITESPDPRFKHEVDHFEMGDGYALYVYAVFPSAAERIAYEAELDRMLYLESDDSDPAFDCFDMPEAAKTNLAKTAGATGGYNAISRLWIFGMSRP